MVLLQYKKIYTYVNFKISLSVIIGFLQPGSMARATGLIVDGVLSECGLLVVLSPNQINRQPTRLVTQRITQFWPKGRTITNFCIIDTCFNAMITSHSCYPHIRQQNSIFKAQIQILKLYQDFAIGCNNIIITDFCNYSSIIYICLTPWADFLPPGRVE